LTFVDTWEEANVLFVARYKKDMLRLPKILLISHSPNANKVCDKRSLLENAVEKVWGAKETFQRVLPYSFVGQKTVEQNTAKMQLFPAAQWICKPTNQFGGNGIFMVDQATVDTIKPGYIVQHYIAEPLLNDGYKFDIRAYVLVGSDGSLWYDTENIHTRTCNVKYDSKNADLDAHITATHRGATSKNILLTPALQQYLPAIHTFIESLAPLFSLLDTRDTRITHVKHFHLLGLDLMLLGDGTPKLIEVNANPGPCQSYDQIAEIVARAALFPSSLSTVKGLRPLAWWPTLLLQNPALRLYLSPKMGHATTELHEKRKACITAVAATYNTTVKFVDGWEDADVIWKGRSQGLTASKFPQLRAVNVLPHHTNLTNKALLVKTGTRVFGTELWNTLHPATRVVALQQLGNSSNSPAFAEAYPHTETSDPLWLVKPAVGFKGANIELVKSSAVETTLQRLAAKAGRKSASVVVQRYLAYPGTLDDVQRKFDIRIYCLVTPVGVTFHPCRKLRVCPNAYNVADTDINAHLTNVSIHGKSEVTYRSGKDTPQYLSQYAAPVDALLLQLKPLLTRASLNWGARTCGYQMFGLDIMCARESTDAPYKAWLLEVNANPGCSDPEVWQELIEMQCKALWDPFNIL
jgi:glutathione synthase/RimK-type ligase-like ATP-grasp enzyme